MDCISQKTVITRKPHHCWGCTRLFPAKAEMRYVTSADGGEISSVYWCKDCRDFMEGLDSWEQEEGFGYGDLLNYDELREKIYPQAIEAAEKEGA